MELPFFPLPGPSVPPHLTDLPTAAGPDCLPFFHIICVATAHPNHPHQLLPGDFALGGQMEVLCMAKYWIGAAGVEG